MRVVRRFDGAREEVERGGVVPGRGRDRSGSQGGAPSFVDRERAVRGHVRLGDLLAKSRVRQVERRREVFQKLRIVFLHVLNGAKRTKSVKPLDIGWLQAVEQHKGKAGL